MMMIICGDFNSRIGTLQDTQLENFPKRTPLDTTSNQHGKHLLNFLNDSNCCVLNGRVNPELGNYTSVRLGKSVVDYMITTLDGIDNVIENQVQLVTKLIEEHEIAITIPTTKMPDHSVLTCKVSIINPDNTNTGRKTQGDAEIEWSGEKIKR